MKYINKRKLTGCLKLCVILVYVFVVYQTYIQNKLIVVPGMITSLSVLIILTLLTDFIITRFKDFKILPTECKLMIFYMLIMLPVGLIGSPLRAEHFNRWIECLTYTAIMVAIILASVKKSNVSGFFWLIYIDAIILCVAFLREPVLLASNRYSIALDVNPNGLGLAMMIGIWAVIHLTRNKKINPIIMVVSIIAFTYVILQTGSRKGFISLLILLVPYYFLCYLPSVERFRRRINTIAMIFLIAICIMVFSDILLPLFENTTLVGRVSDTTQARFEYYEIAYDMFKQSPLFGYGFSGFEYYVGTYSHSTIMEVLVSGGIVGFTFYFGVYVYMLYKYMHGACLFKHFPMSQKIFSNREALSAFFMMLFLTLVIVHPYELSSYLTFALIIAESNCNTLLAQSQMKK